MLSLILDIIISFQLFKKKNSAVVTVVISIVVLTIALIALFSQARIEH